MNDMTLSNHKIVCVKKIHKTTQKRIKHLVFNPPLQAFC